jgi:hypothetical protein
MCGLKTSELVESYVKKVEAATLYTDDLITALKDQDWTEAVRVATLIKAALE